MLGMKREDPARHAYMDLIKKRIKDCEEKGDLEQAKKYKDILNMNNFIDTAFFTVDERRIKNAAKHKKLMEERYKKQKKHKGPTVSNVKIYDENGKELFYSHGPISFGYHIVDRATEEAIDNLAKKLNDDAAKEVPSDWTEDDEFVDPFEEEDE